MKWLWLSVLLGGYDRGAGSHPFVGFLVDARVTYEQTIGAGFSHAAISDPTGIPLDVFAYYLVLERPAPVRPVARLGYSILRRWATENGQGFTYWRGASIAGGLAGVTGALRLEVLYHRYLFDAPVNGDLSFTLGAQLSP